ncbi:hypothetical protein BV22DRAFT_1135953 [Leucogyrophana mollusca]|uniref:Uncharacterized protein n=1 Tax=Leucogyrophana mollusca TaxID=85980 RepID=A0ACB8AU26_9AGAM|nr:hypothetical protein BV22DRAFT_1135953 [Leucogyrophana mollusca]
MPRITVDPALEVCPDFSSQPYDGIRNTIVGAVPNFTHQQAAKQLRDAWTLEHNMQLADWATQEAQDAADAADAEQQRQEHIAEEQRRQELEAENERLELSADTTNILGFSTSRSTTASGDRSANVTRLRRLARSLLERLERFGFL